MSSTPRHPLAQEYLDDLRRAAARLPRTQRRELVAELSDHVDAATAAARSDADIRNLLDDLGDPVDIVNEAAPPPTDVGPTGVLALVLGGLALLMNLLWPLLGIPLGLVGIPLGLVALVLGIRARRHARRDGNSTATATTGVVLGAANVALPILLVTTLATGRSATETELPDDNPPATEPTILGE